MKTFLVMTGLLLAAGGLFLISPKAGAATVTTENEAIPPDRTRGEKNNNPANLEFRSIGWRGEIGSDGRYSVFDLPVNGIRAAMINLHTMFTRDNLTTVREIINRWAPSHENPTDNYIVFVANRVGVSADTPLDWQSDVIPLTRAIVRFENGRDIYDSSLYAAAKVLTGR